MPNRPNRNPGPVNPQGIGLKYSHRKSNLDVESTIPLGGPQNFPEYNHHHQYTPHDTYLDTHQEESSTNSDFGIDGTTLSSQNIFNDPVTGTNLDVENTQPLGGPNRTSAGYNNIPSGQYVDIGTKGTLFNKDGTISTTQLHHWLPTNEYKNSFTPDQLSPESTF